MTTTRHEKAAGRTRAGTGERWAQPPRWRAPAIGAVLGAALGAATMGLMHRSLGDDALISLAYARTLAESGTWGVVPGITANTQTSPLNVWLLAGGVAVVGHPVLVTGALLCVTLALIGWLAVDLARRLDVHPAAGWLTVGLIGTSPVLVATVGLEAYLGAAVLLAVAVAVVARRVVVTGGLCGLAVLVRPDLAVPAAVLAIGLVVPLGSGWARLRVVDLGAVAVVAALVVAPWHLWSWFALGGFVPDTAWVRTGDVNGPSILPAVAAWQRLYPLAAAASVVPVLLALVALVGAGRAASARWARTALLLVLAGWAHLVALELIAAQGAGWYYAPVVACSAAALGLTLGACAPPVAQTGVGAALVLAALGTLLSGPAPWTSAPLTANFARTGQYAAIAQQLPGLTGGQPVVGPGELGALAFYGPVPVLDFLSEPARTDEVMRVRAAGGGLRGALMDVNDTHRRTAAPVPTRWRLSFGSANRVEGRVVRVWPVDAVNRGADTVVLTDRG